MKDVRIEDKAYQAIQQIRAADLKAPRTIVFGTHKLQELGELAMPLARRGKALVVMGARSARKTGLSDRIQTLLNRYAIEMVPCAGVGREPTVAMVDQAAALARHIRPSVVIGAGGGSAMDCAKAVAALAANEGSAADYLEGCGKELKPHKEPLPMIAIPTTAGTGAEMTRNAVISFPEKSCKRSIRDERMIPRIALIDPELSLNVPPHITAAGGMDALSQLIEPCISTKRTAAVTALAHEGLRNVQLAVSVAYEDPSHLMAHERMAFVSMLGGVCLANAGLAMAHGIAAALGALHDVPHGLACGILLPHTLRYNRSACEGELRAALAAFLNQVEPTDRTVDDGIASIAALGRWLQIPPDLKYLGLAAKDVDALAQASMGSSMGANPIRMTPDMVRAFLAPLA